MMGKKRVLIKFRPGETIETFVDTVQRIPYFSECNDREIWIDRDKDVFHHVLEAFSNPEYPLPMTVMKGVEYFQEEGGYMLNELEYFDQQKHNKEKEIVRLNLRGEEFWTTGETLKKCRMLYTRWSSPVWSDSREDVMFLDRSPLVFKHVLSLMRNPDYPFPSEFLYELDFYCYEAPNRDKQKEEEKEKTVEVQNVHGRSGALINLVACGRQDVNFQSLFNKKIPGVTDTRQYKEWCVKNNIKDGELSGHSSHINMLEPEVIHNNNEVVFRISRYSDISSRLFLLLTVQEGHQEQDLVFNFIDKVELIRHETVIDSFNQNLLYIWLRWYHSKDYELFIERIGRNYLVLPLYFLLHDGAGVANLGNAFNTTSIPSEFHMCVTLKPDIPENTTCRLIYDAIFCDTPARRYLAQTPVETPIVQHNQYFEAKLESGSVELTLRSCKIVYQVIMVIQEEDAKPFEYSTELIRAVLSFNGHQYKQMNSLITPIERYLHDVEEPDPSGIYSMHFRGHGVNMSRIDDVKLSVQTGVQKGKVMVWCINWNLLCHGMPLYSN